MQAIRDTISDKYTEALDRWIQRGIEPGGFLQAVLRNDLMEAISRGDEDGIAELRAIVRYLYNKCPRGCWGSPGNYKDWRGMSAMGAAAWTYEN